MNLIYQIGKDFVKFFNVRTRKGLIRALIAIVLMVVVIQFIFKTGAEESQISESKKIVQVGSVSSLTATSDFSLIGTVASKNQAAIQSEAGGRVTKVPVTLGDNLRAGAIIAELENASQYASLLQAQGAYEAAQAAALVNNVTVSDAENNLQNQKNTVISTYRNAYTTANDAVLNNIDAFYSNPNEDIFGVRINTGGQSVDLINERKAIKAILTDWQQKTVSSNTESDLRALIAEARTNITRILALNDIFINLTSTAKQTETLNGVPVTDYSADLLTLRATLSATLSSLNNVESDLATTEDALKRAQLGGTTADISTANAQLKQALGSLRAAEATYQKTIIRTPIAGTLNELKVKTGDYIGLATPVALVANNNALEITTYVGELDASRITIGQTVIIDEDTEGTITAIAPAVDTTTRKTEVKIGSESTSLQNGDTVTINFSGEKESVATSKDLLVPIEAVKFTATEGSMLTVSDSGEIKLLPVKLGPIVGSYVTITEGIDLSTKFVLDARGLTPGENVDTVIN